MSINICMMLIVLGGWGTLITDVEGAFLNGSFQKMNQKVYTIVPPGLRKLYPRWVLLLLLATMYGTIQGALQWFREMVKELTYLQWVRNSCDPCLYYKWVEGKLVVFVEILTRTDRPKPLSLLKEKNSNSKTSQSTLNPFTNISDTRLYKLAQQLQQRLMNRIVQ